MSSSASFVPQNVKTQRYSVKNNILFNGNPHIQEATSEHFCLNRRKKYQLLH